MTVLRVFNWISYVIFSLLILSRHPSLFIMIHICCLVAIVLLDTMMRTHQNAEKAQWLKWLWTINFYSTAAMIFIKYFYFLKLYENTSVAMNTILDFLTQHHRLIGLTEVNAQTSEGLALLGHFLYEGAVVILSWINIYIVQFKVYEAFRTIVIKDENLHLDQRQDSDGP